MFDTDAGQGFDRYAGGFECGFGMRQRVERHQRIIGAVHQQHRRARAQLIGQQLGRDQAAGIAEDAGKRLGAAQPDIKRHHRALRETHQSRITLVEAALLQFLVDKAVEQRRRRPYRGQHCLRGAVLDTEPLITIGRHVARERRVRRDELGIRHEPPPILLQPDQIVAVGAQPVQQNNQPARLAAGQGRTARSGQRDQHRRRLLRELRDVLRGITDQPQACHSQWRG